MSFINFIRANASWLGAGFLLALLSSFGQTFFISIFSGALRNEFDLTHAEWGATYAFGTFSSAVVMVWAGGLSDQFRTRYLGVFVLLGLALSASFMMLNTSATLLILVIFCLRFFGQGMATHLSAVAMSRWFSAQRGRALSIANMGYALGEASLPVAFVVLLAFVEWRLLWGVAGIDCHFGSTCVVCIAESGTHTTIHGRKRYVKGYGTAPLDPCAGDKTSPVLVHGAGAFGAAGLWHGVLFPTGPFCLGKGMDTFGIGGNISFLHGVCDCHDIRPRVGCRTDLAHQN
jgi:MFS family permease